MQEEWAAGVSQWVARREVERANLYFRRKMGLLKGHSTDEWNEGYGEWQDRALMSQAWKWLRRPGKDMSRSQAKRRMVACVRESVDRSASRRRRISSPRQAARKKQVPKAKPETEPQASADHFATEAPGEEAYASDPPEDNGEEKQLHASKDEQRLEASEEVREDETTHAEPMVEIFDDEPIEPPAEERRKRNLLGLLFRVVVPVLASLILLLYLCDLLNQRMGWNVPLGLDLVGILKPESTQRGNQVVNDAIEGSAVQIASPADRENQHHLSLRENPLGYELVESHKIDYMNSSDSVVTKPLKEGEIYYFKISGKASVHRYDNSYHHFAYSKEQAPIAGPSIIWNGGKSNSRRPTPDIWNKEATYYYLIRGTGAPEKIEYKDNYAADNGGGYTFELYRKKSDADKIQPDRPKAETVAADNQSASVEPAFLTQGLVVYYPFNGNALDESGNERHGTPKGAVLTADRSGNPKSAYFFDGTNDYIQINKRFEDSNRLTISTWVKYQSGSLNNRGVIFCDSTLASSNDFIFSISPKGLSLVATKNGYKGQGGQTLPKSIKDVWAHVVWAMTNNRQEVYLDGEHIGSIKAGGSNVGHHGAAVIGNSNSGRNVFFGGEIDDFRIYDWALSAAEVATLYNHEKSVGAKAVVVSDTHSFPAVDGKAFTIPDLSLEMLWCPPGTFTMGSPASEAGRGKDETQHQVTLTKGFWLGKYEVTQAQWEKVMGSNPSRFKGADRPVEKVSWTEAVAFCTQLTTQEQNAGRLPAGWAYVLPTESQWEYACRSGTTTAYSWGATIVSSNANYHFYAGGVNDGRDFISTRDVGQYAANPWGFFDMHGNVWEWTADRYQAAYPNGNPVIDPTGPASGSNRVIRGGSWANGGPSLRSAKRLSHAPSDRVNLGFRLSLRPASKAEPQVQVPEKESVAVSVNAGKAFTIQDLRLEMLWVKAGVFEMGGPQYTRHEVTLTEGYWLGKYEVTQAQWEKIMGFNPSFFKGASRPVEQVSWTRARTFCKKLTEVKRRAGSLPAGMAYQLPTEAQWEYACRAGTTTAYAFGVGLTHDQANIRGGPGETTVVGKYPANAWGFHDMHGNVREWCEDRHGSYPSGSVTDPVGPAGIFYNRVARGGSLLESAYLSRSTHRIGIVPTDGKSTLGFRLSLRKRSSN